ncbi:MAG: fibronectin type III domain-containing protein [Altibacter sp.]|nr:fibronectin type III domain-containing protein [Altibacter sp.]
MKNISLLVLLGLFVTLISCGKDDESNGIDSEKPSVPLNLRASDITKNSVTLSWDASSDNVSVKGYKVYQNGVLSIDNITQTTINIQDLSPETVYTFFIVSYDLAGNVSNNSNSINVSTEPDLEKPSTPINLRTNSISANSVELIWDESSDNVGVSGYLLLMDGVEIQSNISSNSTIVNNLNSNTNYLFNVIAYDSAQNQSDESDVLEVLTSLEFKTNLSEMGVFTGTLSNISPATGVQLYEINSTLFTDYAAKQRLIRLPEGKMLKYDGNFLPVFPDNTLIAKTFYYNIDDRDPSLGKQLIETRIFLKISGTWEVGDYIWNASQTEAVYRETGSEIPISWIDSDGNTQNIDYLIPSKQDCFTCHNNNGTTFPIGLKLRSMNFVPSYTSMNQLDYFANNGLLEGLPSASSVTILPDWTDDATYDIFERGRAYIDVNCAHCHQPGGTVNNFNLDFRYETPFDDTAIFPNRGEIEARIQSTLPTYRMPQLGRTIVHDEAVAMLLDYLQAIED